MVCDNFRAQNIWSVVVCGVQADRGIRPVKTEWWGAGMPVCLELGAD